MQKYWHVFGLGAGVVLLCSCAGYQPFGTTFIRADGQDIEAEQLAADRTSCDNASGKLEDCMSGKGYVLVKEEEASAKQTEFAEAAEKKKQEQAALLAAEKKKQAASHRAAKRKGTVKTASRPKSKSATPEMATAGGPQARGVRPTNAQASPWPQNAAPPPPPWQR